MFFLLHFHKLFQPILTNKFTVFHKACLISLIITFFKVLYLFAWIIQALKTIRDSLSLDAIFYAASTAMFRFTQITVQAARTGLFVTAMSVTDQTIHSTRRKHGHINSFLWHLHRSPSRSMILYFYCTISCRIGKQSVITLVFYTG